MIHENDVVALLPHQLNGLRPALRLVQVKGVALQEAPGHFAVDDVVVHHQHLHPRGGKRLRPFQLRPGHLRHLRNGAPVHNLLGDRDNNRGTLAVDALHTDRSAHQLHQVLDNGQPEPGALHASVALGVHLAEVLKDFVQILLPDAAAGILHPEGNQLLVPVRARLAGDTGPDIALLGELDGVVDDINQNLLDPPLVAVVAARDCVVALVLHDDPALGGRHIHHAYHLAHYGFQVVVSVHQLHFSRLHLGQVQDVVDDGQQVFGGGLHILGVGIDGRVPALLHNDIVETDDSVHGCAYLMGHVGQKLALGNVGLFRLLAHPLDLIDVRLDVGHVQDQNDAALLLPVFVHDLFAVALVVLPVDGKTPGNVLVEHLLPEILHHPDILPQLVGGQAGENVGRRPVVTHQPVVVVQGDHAVPQAFQHLLRRQVPEVVVAAAPHHDDHHGHGDCQCHRRQIEHVGQLEHIGHQHNDGQGGDDQDRLILAADLPVRAQADGPHQGENTKRIGDDDASNHEQHIQRPVGNADIVEAVRSGQPLKLPVKQAVPVEKYRGQNQEIDNPKHAQQLFGRSGVAIGVDKPAVAQRHKGGAHVFHRHRRHSGLHGGSGQLQQVAYILHQRAAHDKNQQLLFPRPVPVEQENQGHKNEACAQTFQYYDKVYHFVHPPVS